MIRYIPEGIELPKEKGLRDKVCYILHLINHLPLVNVRVTKSNGYISLSSRILSRNIGRYIPPLDYLIDNGIIECDGRYLAGEGGRERLTDGEGHPCRCSDILQPAAAYDLLVEALGVDAEGHQQKKEEVFSHALEVQGEDRGHTYVQFDNDMN